MGKYNSADLTTLVHEEFSTPTFCGSQTIFRFKTDYAKHKSLFKGLMYSDYFRVPCVDNIKFHFTVTLSLQHQPKKGPDDFHFVDICYNNPHLTVRTDTNAAIPGNTPAKHLSCQQSGVWAGNDATIDTTGQAFPGADNAEFMFKEFLYKLREYVGLVNTIKEDKYL